MLDEVLTQTLKLSEALEEIGLDIIYARDMIKTTIKNLQELRSDAKFEEIFHYCCVVAKKNNVMAPVMKRIAIIPGYLLF